MGYFGRLNHFELASPAHLFAQNVTKAVNTVVDGFVLALAQVVEEGEVDVEEVVDAREDDLQVWFGDVALFQALVEDALYDAQRVAVALLSFDELCIKYSRFFTEI